MIDLLSKQLAAPSGHHVSVISLSIIMCKERRELTALACDPSVQVTAGVDSSSNQLTDVSTDDFPCPNEDSTQTQQDSSIDNQDESPLQQDTSTDVQDTSSTDQISIAASDQIISTSGQRRRQRRVPQVTEVSHTHTCVHSECLTSGHAVTVQALRNFVNVSGQRIQQIFNQLDRGLKSVDKMTQLGVRDQERDGGQKTNRPPDNQTTSTTDTSTVSALMDKEQQTIFKVHHV